MLVKPQTFSKGGRFPTATARAKYLERDGRAIEKATWNINDEKRWYREMNKTTEQYHCRGSVIGREYVLSPSPHDPVTPERMRAFALEWTARNFPSSEAAIVIHFDNRERMANGKDPICHAHVYVNAPDLETGKKLQLSNARVRELHDSAQQMCRERGWSAQAEYWDEREQRVRFVESRRNDYERRPKWQRLEERANHDFDASSARKAGIGRHEYEHAKSGREFEKTYIRRSLKEARNEVVKGESKTLAEALAKRNVNIERAKNGDFKYQIEGGERSFRGGTLGRQYERSQLESSIKAARGLAPIDKLSTIELA